MGANFLGGDLESLNRLPGNTRTLYAKHWLPGFLHNDQPSTAGFLTKKKADATNVAGEKESCRMYLFFPLFKHLLKMSVLYSLA